MKRINNIYSNIISISNLYKADVKARKGKATQYGVKQHDKNRDANLITLHECLKKKNFTTSEYNVFTIFEPKERQIYGLPFYPDRIVHHAVMNYLEPVFTASFTADTYACIKKRGISRASVNLRNALKDVSNTTYCLKMDIRKFYPSIDHSVLKEQLRRKIKDKDLLWLLDDIIDSVPAGIPIGNYLSQYLSNFYLSGFDHWLKEKVKVKYYFRYADDMVILHPSKSQLHSIRCQIDLYLSEKLKLSLKPNYQVFPVHSRGIDFVGYVFYHTHTRLRKTIKKSFARAVHRRKPRQTLAAYYGWAKHCSSKNLLRKLIGHEKL